jgi:hypothetical protein
MVEGGGGRWKSVEDLDVARAVEAVSLVSIFTVNILI